MKSVLANHSLHQDHSFILQYLSTEKFGNFARKLISESSSQQYIYKISKECSISRNIRYQTFANSISNVKLQVVGEVHYSPRTRIILARYLLAVPPVVNKRIDRATGRTGTRRYTLMSQPSFERDDAEECALFHASIMQLPGNSMERAEIRSAISWKIISVNILMKIMGNFFDFRKYLVDGGERRRNQIFGAFRVYRLSNWCTVEHRLI